MSELEKEIQNFEEALLSINRVQAGLVFETICKENHDFETLENLIIRTLEKIGEKWENGTVSLAQVYMSGIICEELIRKYLPKNEDKISSDLTIAIGVLLDHHALGKRIVSSVLQIAGFTVIDLGHGLTAEQMVSKTLETKTDILLISTLMLHSAFEIKAVKEKLANAGYKGKIIVGGAPFRLQSNLWKEVGADADGKNASNVLKLLEEIYERGEMI